jgi:hypothetical protein
MYALSGYMSWKDPTINADDSHDANEELLPTSVLGNAEMVDKGTYVEYTLGALADGKGSLITLIRGPDSLNIDGGLLYVTGFFYGCTPLQLSEARTIAKSNNRTLGSLGMEWIKAVAIALGTRISEVSLDDEWSGPNGVTSNDLMRTADGLLHAEALRKRMNRVLGDDADAATRSAYLERVRTGGFYGQFNFDNEQSAEPDEILVLKAAM